LFLERALRLARPGGRVGVILPSGIATDHGSADLRRHLLDRTAIDTWVGFDNRRRIFPIHRSVRFVVMSTTNGGSTGELRFRCGLTDPEALDGGDGAAPLTISRSRLAALSPEHLAIPEVTSAAALAIITDLSQRIPALSDASGWRVRFGRELNATDDRPHFVRRCERALPIVEGKQLAPFQVDVDRSAHAIDADVAAQLFDAARIHGERIAYRDVASATNRLTLIAGMLPAGVVSTHTVFVSKDALDSRARWCLLGLLNSLVANYLVRLWVTTHVTTALMARLPVPRPDSGSHTCEQLAALAKQLSVTGIEAGMQDYADLNALAAQAYGLSVDRYRHIVGTFPLLDPRLREACVKAFASLHRAVLPRLE
jgi:hypothetical protein